MKIHPLYQRYKIEKRPARHILDHPQPFRVKIRRWALLKLLIKELFKFKGNLEVITSRPCAYGVFSGPLGGFAPREKLCVGCLRCTTQYPEIATITPNPQHQKLGGVFCTSEQADGVAAEAERGQIAVRGAGYRGKFGGAHWDGLWTDMSEIVRPTRDGIYGREYISTEVQLGPKFRFLTFDSHGQPLNAQSRNVTLPFPMIFDRLPEVSYNHPRLEHVMAGAARLLRTFTICAFDHLSVHENQVIPSITSRQWPEFKATGFHPVFLELDGWDGKVLDEVTNHLPQTQVILRLAFEEDLAEPYLKGIRLFHLTADYHGMGKSGQFIFDLIRTVHLHFVKQGTRDTVSLLGSGGIVAAEHVSKAVLAGLDAIALNIPVLTALQGNLHGDHLFELPKQMTVAWGIQRLKNLMGAWQDQLFETAGAMGMREIRRMRGEMGRVLSQKALENEAFAGIKGYELQ